MNIDVIGKGARLSDAARLISGTERGKRYPDSLIILPIPTSRDGVHITGTETPLSELSLYEGCFVAGYGLPPSFREYLDSCKVPFFDAAEDEKFVLENAEISALGALSYVLGKEKRVPKDIKVGIVGYGRIGKELVKSFLFLGARVKVFTSRPALQFELGECGIEASPVGKQDFDCSSLCGVDVLINTAPANLSYFFPAGVIGKMRVIDLASGDSFPDILGVEYLPSIPEIMYPVSGGAAYGKAIERVLIERYGGGGL